MTKQILTREERLERLVRRMVGTFGDLGNSGMSRIDARAWWRYYRNVARRAGVKISEED